MAIGLCIGLTCQQLECWKDGETLFQHAIKVTENNYLAYNNLGTALCEANLTEEGAKAFQEAIRLKPDYADGSQQPWVFLFPNGAADEAIAQFKEAIRLKPNYTEAFFNLATAFSLKGQYDEAIRQFQASPSPDAQLRQARRFHNNLGAALAKNGQVDEAIREFHEAVRLKPDNPESTSILPPRWASAARQTLRSRNANRHKSAEAQPVSTSALTLA